MMAAQFLKQDFPFGGFDDHSSTKAVHAKWKSLMRDTGTLGFQFDAEVGRAAVGGFFQLDLEVGSAGWGIGVKDMREAISQGRSNSIIEWESKPFHDQVTISSLCRIQTTSDPDRFSADTSCDVQFGAISEIANLTLQVS